MNALRISTHALSLALTITFSAIMPIHFAHAHHINKNAPPGPVKKSSTKKKAVKKSIEKKAIKNKKSIAEKVDIKPSDKKLNVARDKSQEKSIDVKTVKPIMAKPAVVKPTIAEPATVKSTTAKPIINDPVFTVKNVKTTNQPKTIIVQNYEEKSLNSSTENNKLNTLIENKKTQGALIGSIALGAATASPVGLVLGGLGGYMVGKGEQADIEDQEREAEKQKAIKPAPLQANYQACKKMQKSKIRSNLPFCFYSME